MKFTFKINLKFIFLEQDVELCGVKKYQNLSKIKFMLQREQNQRNQNSARNRGNNFDRN